MLLRYKNIFRLSVLFNDIVSWSYHMETVTDEYGVLVEWYWQAKTEILGQKPVPVPLCPLQIPYGFDLEFNPGLQGERPAINCLGHGMVKTFFWWKLFNTHHKKIVLYKVLSPRSCINKLRNRTTILRKYFKTHLLFENNNINSKFFGTFLRPSLILSRPWNALMHFK